MVPNNFATSPAGLNKDLELATLDLEAVFYQPWGILLDLRCSDWRGCPSGTQNQLVDLRAAPSQLLVQPKVVDMSKFLRFLIAPTLIDLVCSECQVARQHLQRLRHCTFGRYKCLYRQIRTQHIPANYPSADLVLRTSVVLGYTNLTPLEVSQAVVTMGRKYRGLAYHLL